MSEVSTGFIVGMVFLAVFVSYVITSVMLFHYPTLIHRKKKQVFRCRHISHRGGAGENLENTMTAFKHALSVGTQMLEIDCQLTLDGQVVVSHDNSLLRSTGLDQLISETNFKDIPPLKPCLKLDFCPNHVTKGSEDKQIPLLRDVFAAFPDTPINIDVKVDSDLLMQKISDLIKEFKREEITVWGNFSNVITNKLHRLNPQVPLLFSMRRVTITILLYYTGLLPFVPLKESFFEVMMPSAIGKAAENLSPRYKRILGLANFLMMSKPLFNHFKRRGIQVYLWVLNEDEDFERAFRRYDVDGVMTDFPTRLKGFLDNHPEYRQSEELLN